MRRKVGEFRIDKFLRFVAPVAYMTSDKSKREI